MNSGENSKVEWVGSTCLGCGGSGIAYFSGYVDGQNTPGYWATCPACNGHGREPV